MEIKMNALCLGTTTVLLLGVGAPVAATTIWGPYGMANVQETSNGYTITNLNGGGTTVIERNATGYSVITPKGTTVIDMTPGIPVEPVIPVDTGLALPCPTDC